MPLGFEDSAAPLEWPGDAPSNEQIRTWSNDGLRTRVAELETQLERAKKIEDAAREIVKQRHGTQKDRHAATAALAAALTPDPAPKENEDD